MRISSITFILALLLINQVFAAYYDTVPAGRRALVFKNIMTSTIDSGYGSSSKVKSYSFNQNININTIKDIAPDIYSEIMNIGTQNPQIPIKDLRFSEFAADLKASLHVQAIGLAWGLSNRLMVYAGLPIYSAKVTTNVRRTLGNNYKKVLEKKQVRIDKSSSVAIDNLQDLSGELVQNFAVKTLKYKPLGDWEAKDFGDIEVGFLMRLTDWDRAGLGISGGFVAPTGRIDDPDLLQDVIAFGDGQWDVFTEFGGSYQLKKLPISVDAFMRYTVQLPTTKIIRAPLVADFTPLGDHKITVYEKLGNKIDARLMLNYNYSDLLSFSAGYEYSQRALSKYESLNATNVELERLQVNSNSEVHYAKASASITTIKAFLAKEFLLPLRFEVSGQTSLKGTNTAKVNRYEATLTMFF